MSAYVFSERARVCVALVATGHFTYVGLLLLMCADMLEAIAGVGIGLPAAFHWTDVGFFPCTRRKEESATEVE